MGWGDRWVVGCVIGREVDASTLQQMGFASEGVTISLLTGKRIFHPDADRFFLRGVKSHIDFGSNRLLPEGNRGGRPDSFRKGEAGEGAARSRWPEPCAPMGESMPKSLPMEFPNYGRTPVRTDEEILTGRGARGKSWWGSTPGPERSLILRIALFNPQERSSER
jgi:hypothetical protein